MARSQVFKSRMLEGKDKNNDLISDWCTAHKAHSAYCSICETAIDVSKRGRCAIVDHSANKSHISNAKKYRDANNTLKKVSKAKTIDHMFHEASCSSEPDHKKLSGPDAATAAEAYWCTAVAVCHLPIQTADKLVPCFKFLFPDSKIAASMECRRNKTSRIISDGLGPYFTEHIENDVRNNSLGYTIEIDETTTEKHWKQLDIMVRYFSDHYEQIVVFHLASFTLGRAQASTILEKISEALTRLYARKLLQISSDGPNVMKSLTEKAKRELNPHLIDISTCNIHKIHNAFSNAYDVFGTDVETLGIDVFYFFKMSPSKREDFEKVQTQLKITHHVFLRHQPTRWLTLQDVNERLIEQLPALKVFFAEENKRHQKSDRVNRLTKILTTNNVLMAEMLFLKSTMAIFARPLRLLQAEAPLIHILYDELSKLVLAIMRRFLKPHVIDGKVGSQLLQIDLDDLENYLRKPDVGTATKIYLDGLLTKNEISQEEYNCFFDRCKKFFGVVVKELLRTLPLKNRLLRDLQFLHPIAREDPKSAECVRRTAVTVHLFPREKIDDAVSEWQMFRSDQDVPKEWIRLHGVTNDDDRASSDEDVEVKEEIVERIDNFWTRVFKLKNLDGSQKYPCLSILVKLCLSLSHGNADVERSFSENKLILTSRRTRMSDATLNGLKKTSSFMRQYESAPANLPISKPLLKAVRESRERYHQRIEQQKAIEKKMEQEKMEKKRKKKNDTQEAQKRIKEAENIRKEGMALLETGIQKKNFNQISAANVLLSRAEELSAQK